MGMKQCVLCCDCLLCSCFSVARVSGLESLEWKLLLRKSCERPRGAKPGVPLPPPSRAFFVTGGS